MKQTTADEKLCIKLLGSFSVVSNGVEISSGSSRSAMMWRLFKYILINREFHVSTDKLIELLWGDSECDNPLHALYSLMYRLRRVLNTGFSKPHEFIVFHSNCYVWNADSPYSIDVDDFERLYQNAQGSTNSDEAIAMYRSAVELYRGELFLNSDSDSWAIAPTAHYSRVFCTCVCKLCSLLLERQSYTEILSICEKAVHVDRFEESFHYYYLLALIKLGSLTQAQQYFDRYARTLSCESECTPTSRILALADSLRTHRDHMEIDIDETAKLLSNDCDDLSPLFCDLNSFQKIFTLEMRASRRSETPLSFVCVDILDNGGNPVESELLELTFSLLKSPTCFGLRHADVLSRYSKSQFYVLLPGASYENAEKAMERFLAHFSELNKDLNISFKYKIKAISK
ncbi:MAG: BTAD domain-containing putative transcriptional regulator [Oscillospiraceae bacterium]